MFHRMPSLRSHLFSCTDLRSHTLAINPKRLHGDDETLDTGGATLAQLAEVILLLLLGTRHHLYRCIQLPVYAL